MLLFPTVNDSSFRLRSCGRDSNIYLIIKVIKQNLNYLLS